MLRLQKYMADCGVGSRRACEKLISEGKVFVDGVMVTEMGVKVCPEKSEVMLCGQIIKPASSRVYIALNKPVGYITSSKDQFSRPTVLDLLNDVNERVFSVGRLDYDSSGLLLLTNDGDFAYRLTHPKHSIYKKYLATVKGVPSKVAINALKSGVDLDGIKTLPAYVYFAKDVPSSDIIISIMEGRNRQVRRMFEKVGHPVVNLHRIAIGNIQIGMLESGKYRFLSENEIRSLIWSEN